MHGLVDRPPPPPAPQPPQVGSEQERLRDARHCDPTSKQLAKEGVVTFDKSLVFTELSMAADPFWRSRNSSTFLSVSFRDGGRV